MNDRELLEMAAKAVGLVICDSRRWPDTIVRRVTLDDGSENWVRWQPLEDDGDALRLAVGLKMEVATHICFVEVTWYDLPLSETHVVEEDWGAGETPEYRRMGFVRRAIVRAAAEIGARLQTPNSGD